MKTLYKIGAMIPETSHQAFLHHVSYVPWSEGNAASLDLTRELDGLSAMGWEPFHLHELYVNGKPGLMVVSRQPVRPAQDLKQASVIDIVDEVLRPQLGSMGATSAALTVFLALRNAGVLKDAVTDETTDDELRRL